MKNGFSSRPPTRSRRLGQALLFATFGSAIACGAPGTPAGHAPAQPVRSPEAALPGTPAVGPTATGHAAPQAALTDQSRAPGEPALAPTPPRPPPPAREPRSEANACQRDHDCAFEPPPNCDCPPCGWVWRRAANRRHVEWLELEMARESCPEVECVGCRFAPPEGGWLLGTRAACVDRQCATR